MTTRDAVNIVAHMLNRWAYKVPQPWSPIRRTNDVSACLLCASHSCQTALQMFSSCCYRTKMQMFVTSITFRKKALFCKWTRFVYMRPKILAALVDLVGMFSFSSAHMRIKSSHNDYNGSQFNEIIGTTLAQNLYYWNIFKIYNCSLFQHFHCLLYN